MQTTQSNPHFGVLLVAYGIKPTLPTAQAAAAINRKPQTLRKWACLEIGPIRPLRINGRLAWLVSDLQALLGGSAFAAPVQSADITQHVSGEGAR